MGSTAPGISLATSANPSATGGLGTPIPIFLCEKRQAITTKWLSINTDPASEFWQHLWWIFSALCLLFAAADDSDWGSHLFLYPKCSVSKIVSWFPGSSCG
jgi:hypothetical protein